MLKLFFFFFFDMSTQRAVKIRTSGIRFMRRSPQSIELPLRDTLMLKLIKSIMRENCNGEFRDKNGVLVLFLGI